MCISIKFRKLTKLGKVFVPTVLILSMLSFIYGTHNMIRIESDPSTYYTEYYDGFGGYDRVCSEPIWLYTLTSSLGFSIFITTTIIIIKEIKQTKKFPENTFKIFEE